MSAWRFHLSVIMMELLRAIKFNFICHTDRHRGNQRKQSSKDLAITLKWAGRELLRVPFIRRDDSQGPSRLSICGSFKRVVETNRDPGGQPERRQARLELADGIRQRVQPVVTRIKQLFSPTAARS